MTMMKLSSFAPTLIIQFKQHKSSTNKFSFQLLISSFPIYRHFSIFILSKFRHIVIGESLPSTSTSLYIPCITSALLVMLLIKLILYKIDFNLIRTWLNLNLKLFRVCLARLIHLAYSLSDSWTVIFVIFFYIWTANFQTLQRAYRLSAISYRLSTILSNKALCLFTFI
jgi:hypothetical protein